MSWLLKSFAFASAGLAASSLECNWRLLRWSVQVGPLQLLSSSTLHRVLVHAGLPLLCPLARWHNAANYYAKVRSRSYFNRLSTAFMLNKSLQAVAYGDIWTAIHLLTLVRATIMQQQTFKRAQGSWKGWFVVHFTLSPDHLCIWSLSWRVREHIFQDMYTVCIERFMLHMCAYKDHMNNMHCFCASAFLGFVAFYDDGCLQIYFLCGGTGGGRKVFNKVGSLGPVDLRDQQNQLDRQDRQGSTEPTRRTEPTRPKRRR